MIAEAGNGTKQTGQGETGSTDGRISELERTRQIVLPIVLSYY